MNRAFDKTKLPHLSNDLLQPARQWLQRSSGELYVEIGAGVGLHPIRFAQDHPGTRIMAVERTADKYRSFANRVANHDLPNLLAIHAEATVFLPQVLEESSVSKFFFLYPNPYPKTSQKNLRWANSPFLHFVHKALKANGTVEFATNLMSYKDELITNLQAYGFKNLSVTEVEIGSTTFPKPRTHFEKKYTSRNESCWNLIFGKQN